MLKPVISTNDNEFWKSVVHFIRHNVAFLVETEVGFSEVRRFPDGNLVLTATQADANGQVAKVNLTTPQWAKELLASRA